VSHPFDRLREFAGLDEAALRARFGSESIGVVVACSELLRPQPLPFDSLDFAAFAREVRSLHMECISGSRALGEAIIRASAHSDANDFSAAKRVLAEFVESCQAPFYRQIAASRSQAIGTAHGA
jgi:hypothetical protein